jgi:hypothetical protein
MLNLSYTPVLLGFVMDYAEVYFGHIKGSTYVQKALIDLVEQYTQPEDRVYLYSPTRLQIPKKKHYTLSQLCNCKAENVNLAQAFDQTFGLLCEQSDYRRYVICITDAFDKHDEVAVKRIYMMDARDFTEVNFIFFGIGDKYDKSCLEKIIKNHPSSFYYHCDTLRQVPEKLTELIKNLTKSEENDVRDVPDAAQLQSSED